MGTRQVIVSDKVAATRAASSHAVKVGNLVFTALTTPRNLAGEVERGDFAAQMHQSMQNVKTILEEAGSSLDRIVKMTVVMPRITDFPEMDEICRSYFKDDNFPARASIEAKMGDPDFLVEIDAIAEIND